MTWPAQGFAQWALTGLAASSLWLGATAAAPLPNREPLTDKEGFMLMFGKGNGAMRVLCALQKHGVIDRATRQRWASELENLLNGPGDSESDRRHTRIGMAFADARASSCPERIMGRVDP